MPGLRTSFAPQNSDGFTTTPSAGDTVDQVVTSLATTTPRVESPRSRSQANTLDKASQAPPIVLAPFQSAPASPVPSAPPFPVYQTPAPSVETTGPATLAQAAKAAPVVLPPFQAAPAAPIPQAPVPAPYTNAVPIVISEAENTTPPEKQAPIVMAPYIVTASPSPTPSVSSPASPSNSAWANTTGAYSPTSGADDASNPGSGSGGASMPSLPKAKNNSGGQQAQPKQKVARRPAVATRQPAVNRSSGNSPLLLGAGNVGSTTPLGGSSSGISTSELLLIGGGLVALIAIVFIATRN